MLVFEHETQITKVKQSKVKVPLPARSQGTWIGSPQKELFTGGTGGRPTDTSSASNAAPNAKSREIPAIWLANAPTVIEFQSTISISLLCRAIALLAAYDASSGTYFVMGWLKETSPTSIR